MNNIREFKIITRQLPDGSEEKRKVYELTEDEAGKFKKIGSASGPSLEFCFYLGWKHTKNFQERVCGYRISTGGIASMIDEAQKKVGLNKPKYINIEFYEQCNKSGGGVV